MIDYWELVIEMEERTQEIEALIVMSERMHEEYCMLIAMLGPLYYYLREEYK